MFRIILTGTTGFVGEEVLLENLKIDKVEKVLSFSRKPSGRKLSEIRRTNNSKF